MNKSFIASLQHMISVLIALTLASPAISAADRVAKTTELQFQRSIEALRYRTADGVEVIRNRVAGPTVATAPAATHTTAPPTVWGSTRAPPRVPSDRGAVASVQNVVQSPANQKSRLGAVPADGSSDLQTLNKRPSDAVAAADRERMQILTSELINEARELATKNRLLKTPRGTNDLVDQMYTRLQREVSDHEENIRALNREIRRLPAQ